MSARGKGRLCARGSSGVAVAGVACSGLGSSGLAGFGHHDLCAAPGASHTPAASRTDSGWIGRYEHVLGKAAGNLGGDVALVGTEVDEAAVAGQRPVAEAPRVVADEVQRAEPVDKATDYALARGEEGARPDENTSQRLCQPTVGANCRGGVTTDAMGWLKCGAEWTLLAPGRASTLESVLDEESNTHKHTRTHAVYPGSGPSCGGNTPTPACLSLFRTIRGYKVAP